MKDKLQLGDKVIVTPFELDDFKDPFEAEIVGFRNINVQIKDVNGREYVVTDAQLIKKE